MSIDFLTTPIRETAHRGDDDLLTAGLGLAGLRGAPTAFANPDAPTPQELRRRAIQANWKGIADLGPLGGYGTLYGSVAAVPGREYQAFAKIPGARSPHRVLLQAPDNFDAQARCLIVTAASGSRGIYGAIALAGAWGLTHGCAVAYTDKGAGTGYFDGSDNSGVTLDGTRATAGEAPLEFDPDATTPATGIAVKHAHSGDNPEADWGRHVLQAARFGLAMLERAYPQAAPFTPHNTRILAVGLSNGGGAVLQAAGFDDDGLLSGVIALAPNIHAPTARPLHDFTTEAALLMPCALSDARFDAVPLARVQSRVPPTWNTRGAGLRAAGLLHAGDAQAQAAQAVEQLKATGWTDAMLASAASSTLFDMWRAIAATYASSYARAGFGAMPCGYTFFAHDAQGNPRTPSAATRAAWWADAGGIPPGAGVMLGENGPLDPADPTLQGLLCLRALGSGQDERAQTLRASIDATHARLPRQDLPIWVIHGTEDGLLPMAFTSEPYVAWLRANARAPTFWPIEHAQHFDAFLALTGFGDRYVPLLAYGYRALDHLHAHVTRGAPLAPDPVPRTTARGGAALDAQHLGM